VQSTCDHRVTSWSVMLAGSGAAARGPSTSLQLHRRVGMVRLWRRGAVNGARMDVRPSQRTGERLLRPGSLATNKEWLGQVERATTCWKRSREVTVK